MNGLNRDTKCTNMQTIMHVKRTVKIRDFQKRHEKFRDLVGERLVAGRLLDHMSKNILLHFFIEKLALNIRVWRKGSTVNHYLASSSPLVIGI
jgi:hypothetical protein